MVQKATHLFERLQQVAAGHRQCDVYMVHNEQRLFLTLKWETGEIVCDKQQHVHIRLLYGKKTK